MSFDPGGDEAGVVASPPAAPVAHDPTTDKDTTITPSFDQPTQAEVDSETRERLEHVLKSDIGVTTLLQRLKSSIGSTRDFAGFLRERSYVEEKHAQGLRRLCRSTHELIRRPDNRGASFAYSLEEMLKTHDRMADNGLNFANSLHQMQEELHDLAAKCERDRKHLKASGLEAERTVHEAEAAMAKAKAKYNSLAEQLDAVKTGEKTSGKFGRRKDEDELRRKLESADNDYAQKVQSAQSLRRDLLSTNRPRTVSALQDAIHECDAALSLQIQKYATLSERLLLSNGLAVSPIKDAHSTTTSSTGAVDGAGPKSLRELAHSINNQSDLREYILGFSNRVGAQPAEARYEQHPTLAPKQQQPSYSTQQPSHPPPVLDSAQSQPYGAPDQEPAFSRSVGSEYRVPGSEQTAGSTLPYQTPTADRLYSPPPSAPPPAQYQSGPPPPNTYAASQAPQLPQITSFSDSSLRQDLSSAPGDQADPALEPPQPSSTPSRSDLYSGGAHTNGYTPPATAPPASGGRGAPQGRDFATDGRGPSFSGSASLGSRGPSLGQQNDFSGSAPINPLSAQAAQAAQAAYSQNAYPLNSQAPGVNSSVAQHGISSGAPRSVQHGPSSSYAAPTSAAAAMSLPSQQRRAELQRQNLLPLRPVFGVPLEELFRRDNSAVPLIVYRCIEAVDLHGLDVEGLYRVSGSVPVITELRQQFDHDASQVDFRNPAAFKSDIASVTTLLKHFLRDLPDPLLTSAAYSQFIRAAQIDNDDVRRDSLHAIINSLPDPNYATLRVLTIHLYKVSQHAERNRMTPQNLAICFAPTLMGHGGKDGQGDVKDSGWQVRVIETIINNTFQIFDDDE